MESPEPVLEQAVHEAAARRLEDVEARRFRQGTRRAGLERFDYRTVFRGRGAMRCPMLKDLELTTG